MHKIAETKLFRVLDFAVGVVVAVTLAITASAQNPQTPEGWNASVFSGTGNNVMPSPSYAVVDATQFAGSDVCTMINNVFSQSHYNGNTSNGIVVDARGVPSSALNCSSGTNPWSNLISSGTSSFWNIVLLPAGTIQIQATWTMPNWTHLIGQGPNSTVIQAASGFGSDMIDMGQASGLPCSSLPDCPGIVIEHLGLKGSGAANGGYGIVNCCAQEQSRVNDVSISNVKTGLWLSDRYAENSGPYSNLTISGVNTCLAIGPAMTAVSGLKTMINSRGVHGMTCAVNGNSPAAITIDGPNNSLEDISISTSSSGVDGILIGAQGPAQGNTLLNIQGSGLQNVIHISNHTNGGTTGGLGSCPYYTSNTVYNVCDLTILGVARFSGTNTVQDDLWCCSNSASITDTTLAMYTLGEIVIDGPSNNLNNIGLSRYTTATASANTNATPWLVGATAPTGTSCKVGTLYSCTGSSCAGALYECLGGGTTWKIIQ
jgi:hypothetical protein